jgi:hypothetical protein
VVGVAVGDEDGPDPVAVECRRQRVPVAVEHGPGIDHDDVPRADDVRAGAAVGELGRVLGDHPADRRRHLIDPAVLEVVLRECPELGRRHQPPPSTARIRPTGSP